MSDARLRRLERAWKASGTVEAEATLLEARVQEGHLAREDLELAAYCGHLAARTALGAAAPAVPESLDAWAAGLPCGPRGKVLTIVTAYDVFCADWRPPANLRRRTSEHLRRATLRWARGETDPQARRLRAMWERLYIRRLQQQDPEGEAPHEALCSAAELAFGGDDDEHREVAFALDRILDFLAAPEWPSAMHQRQLLERLRPALAARVLGYTTASVHL